MIAKDRPENNIFVLTYLTLLALGALFGALVVFALVIPEVLELGKAVAGAVAVVGALGVLSLLVAGAATYAGLALWRGQPAGRTATLVLSAIMAFVSLISIPVLLLVGMSGIALTVPLATAVILFLASAAVLLALRQPGW